jgi:cytochrome c biogenesis protein CcdA
MSIYYWGYMYLSLMAAYFGGVLSLLTPCSGLVVPSFAAAVLKRRYHPLVILGLFGAGMLLLLVPLALGASTLSKFLFLYRRPLTLVIGWAFLAIGIGLILGKQIKWPDFGRKLTTKAHTGAVGLLILGMISAIGASACVGPILGAIMSLSIAQNSLWGVLTLVFAYAAGILTPLLIFTFGLSISKYQRLRLLFSRERKWGKFKTSLSDLLAGLLLLVIGYIFIVYQGSMSQISLFGPGFYEAIFDLQESLF